MALRVLLADESASIRKVFQLGLQDYGAEVKSVHNGLDVMEVAEQFQPDIIFADILLQKKDGYQVSEEVKNREGLAQIPVILMWSSFMELDQAKYQKCGADGEMEKPFEVDIMRRHIDRWVPKSKSQQLSQFLTFPKKLNKQFLKEFHDNQEADQKKNFDEAEEADSVFNTASQSFEVELEPVRPADSDAAPTSKAATLEQEEPEDQWQSAALGESEISVKNEGMRADPSEGFTTMQLSHEGELRLDEFLYNPNSQSSEPANIQDSKKVVAPPIDAPSLQLSAEQIEAIVRAHTQEVIKLNIQEQLPKIIERIARQELDRLLKIELSELDGDHG